MDSDTDEDVLFENSPLHQHLLEVGAENVITAKILPKQEDRLAVHTAWQSMMTWCLELSNRVKEFLLGCAGFIWMSQEIKKMESFYRRQIVTLALDSESLEEDDKRYLEHFSGIKQTTTKEEQDPVLGYKILLMFGVPCVLSYFYGRLMWLDFSWRYKEITDISAIVVSTYFLHVMLKTLYLTYQKWTLEDKVKRVMLLLTCGETFFKNTKKCLRLIQESELVARGFTLVSHKSPLSRLEQSSVSATPRQCPQLRLKLFLLSRECLVLSKSLTSHLLIEFPVPADSSLHCLASIPIDEYGPCLQINKDDPDSQQKLYDFTDGYSVAAIKGVSHVCRLQYSEFCRCLVLRIVTDKKGNKKLLQGMMKDLQSRMQLNSKELETIHDYYKTVSFSKDSKEEKKVNRLSDLDLAVHSLDLHLQAALLRVRKLSLLIEHTASDSNGKCNQTDQSQEVLLRQIKQELQACKGCWEEGLDQVEKLCKCQPEKGSVTKESEEEEKLESKQNEQIPVDLFNIGDPVIEDQVFEAYIDDDDENVHRDTSWDEFLSPEDKARKKKEKQEALRLLTELKSVISVRAVEMDRRERIAQKRMCDGCEAQERRGYVNDGGLSIKTNEQGLGSNVLEEAEKQIKFETFSDNSDDLAKAEQSECDVYKNQEVQLEDDISTIKLQNDQDFERQTEEMFSSGKNDTVSDCSLGNFSLPGKTLPLFSLSELAFSSNLAAMAVAKSQGLGLQVETFGDSEADDDSDVGDS